MDQMLEKLGGSGGGVRRTSKKAKAKKDTSPSLDEYLSTRPKLAKRAAEGRKDLAKSASKLRVQGRKKLAERKSRKEKNLEKMIEKYGEKSMKERYGKMYGDWFK